MSRRIFRPVFQAIRNAFLSGLLVVLPAAVTVWVIAWVAGGLEKTVMAGLEWGAGFLPEIYAAQVVWILKVPGLGIALALVTVVLVGLLARTIVGRAVVNTYERLLARVPVVSSIYSGVKELLELLFSRQKSAFQKVVLAEWPRRGLYSVGFLTGDAFITKEGEGQMVCVFLPTTPNPTTGFFFMLPDDRLIHTDLTVEQGFKLLMSSGIISPPESLHIPKRANNDRDDGMEDPGVAPVLLATPPAAEPHSGTDG